MAEMAWVPDSCTLPSSDRPLRVAEFDTFFAESLHTWRRPSAGLLSVVLNGDPDVRDLIARETECCSFFTFTLGRDGEGLLVLDISVSAGHEGVLDALAERLGSPRQRTADGGPA